jgi:hypothetical protein
LRCYCLAALTLLGCGPSTQPPKCGMELMGSTTTEGSHLSEHELMRYIRYALEGATQTTDPQLTDVERACSRMAGMRVYTNPNESFAYEGNHVAGVTNCNARWMMIGTPPSLNWGLSSLTHELFHAMQGCGAALPLDEGTTSAHANWRRDGIFAAISAATARNDQ